MPEPKQITLAIDAGTPELLRHAATLLRALGEALPITLAEARLHLRHEARELEQLARAIEREIEDA